MEIGTSTGEYDAATESIFFAVCASNAAMNPLRDSPVPSCEGLGDRPDCLWVAERNRRARAFHAKLGFTVGGAREDSVTLVDELELRMQHAGTVNSSAATQNSGHLLVEARSVYPGCAYRRTR